MQKFSMVILAALTLTGCASTIEEVRTVGKPPEVTPIENPAYAATGRRHVWEILGRASAA